MKKYIYNRKSGRFQRLSGDSDLAEIHDLEDDLLLENPPEVIDLERRSNGRYSFNSSSISIPSSLYLSSLESNYRYSSRSSQSNRSRSQTPRLSGLRSYRTQILTPSINNRGSRTPVLSGGTQSLRRSGNSSVFVSRSPSYSPYSGSRSQRNIRRNQQEILDLLGINRPRNNPVKCIMVNNEEVPFDIYAYYGRNKEVRNKYVLYYNREKQTIGIKFIDDIRYNYIPGFNPDFSKRKIFYLKVLINQEKFMNGMVGELVLLVVITLLLMVLGIQKRIIIKKGIKNVK